MIAVMDNERHDALARRSSGNRPLDNLSLRTRILPRPDR